MSCEIHACDLLVLGPAAVNSFSPQAKRRAFQLASHESDDVAFRQAELRLDSFEWSSVFPRHFYNSIGLAGL